MFVQATGLSRRNISPVISVHRSLVHHKHVLLDTCLSCWLRNSAVIAKVSAPDAAGWNPPDWAAQASAAPHVYTNPSCSYSPALSVSPSSSLSKTSRGSEESEGLTDSAGMQDNRISLCVNEWMRLSSLFLWRGRIIFSWNDLFAKRAVGSVCVDLCRCLCPVNTHQKSRG